MARFVLIDQSVTSPGGHNFEHANDLLHAAEASGYEPVLVANQAISEDGHLPSSWRILPFFPDSWDSLHWIGPDGRSDHAFDIDGRLLAPESDAARPRGIREIAAYWGTRVRDAMRYRDRQACIFRFAEACSQLWQSVRPCGEDLVFLPSVTEFDLLGLVRFLKSEPESKGVDWHLLFHFNLFGGRTPAYGEQPLARSRFRQQFAAALAHVPEHRLHFYGVTDLIAEQYNRLGTATFTELPYTINGSIQVDDDAANRRPLRLVCPGVIRREKGKRQIKSLVRHLWSDHLSSGDIQLLFQGQAKDLRRFFPRETLPHSTFTETSDTHADDPIVIVRHPLSAADYAKLIRDSHIGIFLHDSERYFGRCSGTLVELLGAGVPVIVPAGCWLAEQIAEPIYKHLEQLVGSDAAIEKRGGDDLRWTLPPLSTCDNRPLERVWCGETSQAAECEIRLPHGAGDAVLSFGWPADSEPGHYMRWEAKQFDSRGRLAGEPQVAIVGGRLAEQRVSTLFALDPLAVTLRLTATNAYDNTLLPMLEPQVAFLRHSCKYPFGFPGGQVGLIAADLSQFSRLLRDMKHHYAHYRRSAIEFSHDWSLDHSAHTVIERIRAVSQPTAGRSQRDAAA